MAHYQYEGLHFELPDGLSNDEAISRIETHLGKKKAAPTSKSLGAGDYLDASIQSAKRALTPSARDSHSVMTEKTLEAIYAAKGEATPFEDTIVGRALTGLGETALWAGTGAFQQVQGTGAGLINTMLGNAPDLEKEIAKQIADKTYQPRTKSGQKISGAVGQLLNDVGIPMAGVAGSIPRGQAQLARLRAAEKQLRNTPEHAPVAKPGAIPTADPMQAMVDHLTEGAQSPYTPPIDPMVAMREQLAKAGEQQRGANADAILAARQAAMEQEVARQTSLEQNAALRARQEQAPTGYAEWVARQQADAETRRPGDNTPMEMDSPYPVDANQFPQVMKDAPYKYEGALDYDQPMLDKSLPVEVRDALGAGTAPDPFNRYSPNQVARRILIEGEHPPIKGTWDPRINRFGQGGALDGAFGQGMAKILREGFKVTTRALSRLTDQQWLKERFPASNWMSNTDGTPTVLLHGTRAKITGELRASTEGFHAGFTSSPHMFAGRNKKQGNKLLPKTSERRIQYGPTEAEGRMNQGQLSGSLHPIVIKKGNYPLIDFDMGTWDVLQLTRSDKFALAVSKLTEGKYGYYDVKEMFKDFNDKYRGTEWENRVKEVNDAWSSLLKNQLGVDGFTYPNKFESVKKLLEDTGEYTRAKPYGHPTSFVTWNDNNIRSIYKEANAPSTLKRSQGGSIHPDLLTLGIPKAAKYLKDKFGDDVAGTLEKAASVIGRKKEPVAAYLEKLPGLSGKADAFISRPTPSAELLDKAKAQADGPDLATNWQSGLAMAAQKGDSIVLRNMGEWFNWAQNRANYLIREAVVPLESRLAHLGKDLQNVHKTFLDEMFRGEQYSPEQLSAMGMKQKGIDAYQSLRKAFDTFYEEQNRGRQLLGKSPITKQDAYMASIFRGDYHLPIYDKGGKLRFYIQTTTRGQAKGAIEWLKKEFADNDNFDFSGLKYNHSKMYNPGRKYGAVPRDVMSSWKDIAEAMGDDPLAAEIKQAMERWVEAKGSHAFKQDLHHVKAKVNVRGFEGDQPWLSAEDNAHNWAKAQIDYLKDAARWSATQEAISNVKTLLTDPDILQNQPNNVTLGKAYMYNQMGLTENLARSLESAAAGAMGLSRESINSLSSVLRSGLYIKTLTASPGYIVATPIQAIHGSFAWFLKEQSAGNVKVAPGKFLRNVFEAMADERMGVPMSSFNKEALKWADDNGVIKNIVYEDDRSIGTHPVADSLQKVSDWSIGVPDRFARRAVFIPFANALWDSGKYSSKEAAFRRAGEITDAVAVSMRPQDRPLAVQKLGQLGTMGYVFHAPVINMYNHLSILGREAARGNVTPLMGYLGTMAAIGGIWNLPGIGELEKLFEMTKGFVSEHMPGSYGKIKDINPRLAVLKALPEVNVLGYTGGEWLSYGGASGALGTDMRGRFSNEIINAEDPLGSALPVTSVYGDMAGSAVKAMANPNAYTGMQLAKDMAPGGLARGLIETSSDRFKAPVQPYANQGVTSFRKPSDITEPGVHVNRDDREIMARRMGVTALTEAVRREKDAMSDKETARLRVARKGVFDNMFKAIVNKTGDENTVREAVRKYLELEGNPQDIERQLERKFADLPFTRQQQQLMKAKRYEQIMGVVRRMEMDR